MWELEIPKDAKPLGYKKLVEIFNLNVFPHYRWSYVSSKWEKKEIHSHGTDTSIFLYPPSYRLSDDVFEHLEFALKYEGLNLLILKKVLLEISASAMVKYLQTTPSGKYARVLWYLFEKFHREILPLPDLKAATYIPLLDPDRYYSGKPTYSVRHKILENLIGNTEFSPIIRKTNVLMDFEKKEIGQVASQLTKQYDPSILARALRYMYTKETMSSWEIERERPDQAKLTKFVNLLHKADSIGPLSEQTLVELQKSIVDPRFASNHYRTFQNYIGEEPSMGQLIIHFIPPRPENVQELMDHLIKSFENMEKSGINAVIAAAVLSFAFVLIHPFEDGNGRIHRFLIHYALAHLKFTPEGVVFPISTVIVKNMKNYDSILESFSKPLMELIGDYKINDIGELQVLHDSCDLYRFIDFTLFAEFLFQCVDKTVMSDFQEELSFIVDYDMIKKQIKEVVDMPDQRIDLFIKCVRQNNGVLSLKKKESYFQMLTDEEIRKMENIISNK